MLTKELKYAEIITNRDLLLKLTIDKNHDGIFKQFIEMKEIPENLNEIIHINISNIKKFIESEPYNFNNGGTRINIIDLLYSKLFAYACYNSDTEFIKELLYLHNIAVFDFYHYDDSIKLCNDNTFRFILDNFSVGTRLIDNLINDRFLLNERTDLLISILQYKHRISNYTIITAIADNHINLIRVLIENNQNVQEAINNTNVYSCHISDISMAKLLRDYGIDITKKLNNSFIKSIENDNIELAEHFLNYDGININLGFLEAISNNNIRIIELLLKYGADINSIPVNQLNNSNIDTIKFFYEHNYRFTTESLSTILYNMLCTQLNIKDVLYIIDIGADMNIICEIKNNGWLMTAIYNNYYELFTYLANNHLIKLISEKSLLVESCIRYGNIKMLEYLSEIIEIDYNEITLETLFYKACQYKQYDSVIYVLKLGFDIETVDVNYAMELINDYSHLIGSHDPTQIIKLFVSYNINVYPYLKFDTNPSELFNEKFISEAIENGYDINKHFEYRVAGNTINNLLELSIYTRNIDMVKFLLNNGVMSSEKSFTLANREISKILESYRK